jgi:putative nucleotidyltransferase with HDIG domain
VNIKIAGERKMEELAGGETAVYQQRLILRQRILRKQASFSIPAHTLITTVMRIARRLLNASASSILLSEESSQRLIFAFADGSSGEQIKRLKMSKNSGIAGLVVTSGEPIIVNDVYQNKHFNNFVDTVTGHTTKSIICAPLATQDRIIGVVQMVNKLDGANFSERDLYILQAIAAPVTRVIADIRRNQNNLVAHHVAIKLLLSAIGAGESSMSEHAKRVSQHVLKGADALSLSKDEKQVIQYAAVLHDIGKLGRPDGMPDKSANLANEEQVSLDKHPVIGFNMLKGLAFLQEASKFILYHHERHDGNGYPKGLKGNAIPLGARLIAVADAFDNMTTERSHRAALSQKAALMELRRCAGSKFDPAAVTAFYSGFVNSITPSMA